MNLVRVFTIVMEFLQPSFTGVILLHAVEIANHTRCIVHNVVLFLLLRTIEGKNRYYLFCVTSYSCWSKTKCNKISKTNFDSNELVHLRSVHSKRVIYCCQNNQNNCLCFMHHLSNDSQSKKH